MEKMRLLEIEEEEKRGELRLVEGELATHKSELSALETSIRLNDENAARVEGEINSGKNRTGEIDASIKSVWYRFSRREDDYCIECSKDGVTFSQMRVCHMWNGGGKIQFGIYACSPEASSFKATFTNMEVTECKWLAHDGQQPDGE